MASRKSPSVSAAEVRCMLKPPAESAYNSSAVGNNVPKYQVLMARTKAAVVERVQTGIRMERRILKVLKATAELKDLSLGDLLEGIVLHAFEGKAAFGAETLRQIAEFKSIYGL